MSDTYSAPPVAPAPPPAAPHSAPGAAPAAAPGSAHETPVNPNPVSLPQPIGSQAPAAPVDMDKHQGSPHRPQSRHEQTREAIRDAFKRVEAEPPKPGREPARARMGHNQPPEPMERETPAKPAEPKVAAQAAPRPRGEDGRFAPAANAPTAAASHDGVTEGATQAGHSPGQPVSSNVVQLPEWAAYRDAPKRWRNPAKEEWHATPESVRGEVYRMHGEFANAYEAMRADVEEMNRIRPYHELAKQQGTTLDKALSNYIGIEAKLRADPIAGLDVIVNNLNLRTADGQRIGLRDIAWHVLNQTPDQLRSTQLANSQTASSQQMQQLREQQMAIAQALQEMQYQQRFSQTRSEVDRFAETHPRLDELADLIQTELNLGFDLPEAYRRAELLRPATHAAQTRTQAAQTRTQTAQTRSSTDRSISGAPDRGPPNGHDRPMKASGTARDSVARAVRLVNGSL